MLPCYPGLEINLEFSVMGLGAPSSGSERLWTMSIC